MTPSITERFHFPLIVLVYNVLQAPLLVAPLKTKFPDPGKGPKSEKNNPLSAVPGNQTRASFLLPKRVPAAPAFVVSVN